VFVSRRARAFLAGNRLYEPVEQVLRRTNIPDTGKLQKSQFGTAEDIAHMTSIFDKSTKLRFRNPDEPSYIKFGGVRDKDPGVGIRSGQLKLLGSVIIHADQHVSYGVPGRMLLLFLSLPFKASLMQLNSSRNPHIRPYRSVNTRMALKPLITDRDQ
jgi:hypothetical protein